MPEQIVQDPTNWAIENCISVLKTQKNLNPDFDEEITKLITVLEDIQNEDAILRKSGFVIADGIIATEFLENQELQILLKEIVGDAKERIAKHTRIKDWKSKVNDYELEPQSTGQAVTDLLTNTAAQEALYHDAHPEGAVIDEARKKFLDYLDKRHQLLDQETKRPRPTISMEALLGEEGIKLYHAAIAEEGKSREFREAVFLKSTQHYEGDKWDKKLILWVGGPSASGKTYGASGAVKAMAEHMPKAHDEHDATLPTGNNVVSVDGGIEREMSQMRQMVLQSALSKGYSAISDLHANTKFNTKEQVKAAALAQDDLSLVIPETFAESALLKRFGPDGAYKIKEMQRYHAMPNAIQAFSEIRGVDGQLDRFQTSVYHMGTTRAALSEDITFDNDQFQMNNRDIGCESKEYGSSGFLIGKFASQQARNNLKEMDPEGLYICITNDLMFVHKNADGNWIESTKNDHPEFRLSARDFTRWHDEKISRSDTPDLKEWYAIEKAANRLAPQLIEVVPNDLVPVLVQSLGVKIQISKRDLDAYKTARDVDPRISSIFEWCEEKAAKRELITPLNLIRSSIEQVIPRSVSAPNLTMPPESRQPAVRLSESSIAASSGSETQTVSRQEPDQPKPTRSPGLKSRE